jgi:hypothetical protein
LTLSSAWRFVRAAVVVLGLLFLLACAVPLGPGYQIEQLQFEVRYLMTSPARLHVRASYRLKNIGNSKLLFLEVTLPGEQSLGRQSLRAWVDGREISLQPVGIGGSRIVRIPFDPPWPQKQRRVLAFGYDLAPPAPGHAMLAVNDASFHSRDAAAFPLLRPPQGAFVKRGKHPKESRLVIQVPQDFQVFAGGWAQGSHGRGGETEHRFGVSKRSFEPFVVAGRYHQQQIHVVGATVILWTFEPLAAEQAQVAATRLAGSFQTFRTAFGSPWKTPPPVRLIETPAQLTQRSGSTGDAAGVALPAGALLNRQAFALGITRDTFLSLAEHELAHTWFGQTIEPRPETEAALGEGLAEYTTIVAADARGGDPERRHRAALLLRWFDESRKNVADKPLLRLEPSDPFEQRVFGYSKGALFFLALEDRYGKENVRRALAHLVSSLRGSRFGYAELLSALELETQEKLGDFFRRWLDQTGIPDEVRARYEVRDQRSENRD